MRDDSTAVEEEQCPHCRGGIRFSSHRSEFITCPDCRGQGTIICNILCACGGPVFWLTHTDSIYYCGEDSCLKKLRDKLAEEKKAAAPNPRYQALSCNTSFPGYGERKDE